MGSRRTPEDRAAELVRDRAALAWTRPRTSPLSAGPERRAPGSRHCWVRRGDAAVEGLLLSWVRSAGGWDAEVLVVEDGAGPRTVTVPASDVRTARRP